ncbi:extracellular solute-binding protein [Nonomuraea sp. K274]|uniref:Extracellular solute-binding protein n=1 Tax=Nonomuraea cypriaca TaxID=1187855 RepID=A0A931A6M4_9ACTN|nr:extracellular solute-binding protein [Nonomuraea cypriaca]MBF8186133.1 extracellular solute-binding protein [Nonomuraea cypriaca]
MRSTGLMGLMAAVAACGGSTSAGSGGSAGRLTWWDAQESGKEAKEALLKKFAESPGGIPVEYTHVSAAKFPQAIQLAKQSNQLPDIHVNVGITAQVEQLIKDGWVAPLELGDTAMKRLEGKLYEGIHTFEGKVYTWPIYHFRQYMTVNWFDTTMVAKAGLDPNAPPATYDEFRAACAATQKASGGESHGFAWCVGMPIRLGFEIDKMAQAGGFEGADGIQFRTGEYAYHSDPYVNAIEFMLSLHKDGLMAPGSLSWSDDVARGRWVAGAATYFFSGPWTAGSTLETVPQWKDKLGVGPILVPEAGRKVATYAGPNAGTYWLSPTCKHPKEAGRLLGDYFATEQYSVDLANAMLQPPADLEAVEKSNAHPMYKKLIGWYAEQAYLCPAPVLRNPKGISAYQAEVKEITPGLGDIIQGAFTGDIPDYRKALKELSDKNTAERDRAIAAAKAKGAEVSVDDWAFPKWAPEKDFTLEMYG